MKKPWLKSCLLSLSILFVSANILPFSFNSLASASYDPGNDGVIHYEDGEMELMTLNLPTVTNTNAITVSQFNYDEKKHNSDQNAAHDDANANATASTAEEQFENSVNEAIPPENQLPEQENNNSEPLNEDHNDLTQQNNAEDVNDENFTEDHQSEGSSDNQINEDNSVDEDNLPIVVDIIQVENGCEQVPDPQALNIYGDSNEDPLLSPISEQEEKTNCCGCLLL